MTLAFSGEVVHEKLWKSVTICKSYSKKISGTFFFWTRCRSSNSITWLATRKSDAHRAYCNDWNNFYSDKREKIHKITNSKLEGHSVERIYLRQRSSDGSVNNTILKPRLALATRRQYVYVGFSRRKIPRSSAARWQPRQDCKVL